jgi:hypothetical protein
VVPFVGPSFGHLYAQNYAQAAIGTGVRIAGSMLVLAALPTGDVACDPEPCPDREGRNALFVGGLGLVIGSTIYDVFSAPTAANQYNRRRGLAVVPVVGPQRGIRVAVRM